MLRKECRFLRIAMLVTFTLLLDLAVSFAQKVPAPEEVLGFKVGADYHLATYEQAVEYFKALEKSSPRIKLFEMGKSEGGQNNDLCPYYLRGEHG